MQGPDGRMEVGPALPEEEEGVSVRWNGRRPPVYYRRPDQDDLDFIVQTYGQEVLDIYQENIPTICRTDKTDTVITPGQFKEYNIKLPPDKVGSDEIVEHVKGEIENSIMPNLPFQFKMFISFGSILEETTENGGREYRYFYPGNENFAENLITVHEKSQISGDEIISEQNFNESVTEPRENSSTKFVMATNCHVKIFSMDRPLVGANTEEGAMPEWLQRRHCIFYPSDRRNEKLCVFDCIAYSQREVKRSDRIARKSKELARRFCQWQKENRMSQPVSFEELKNDGLDILSKEIILQLEDFFSINIDLYTLYSEQPYIENQYEERRPILCLEHGSCNRHNKGDKIILLAHNGHCVLIKDLSKLSPNYACPYCKITFSKKQKFQNHKVNCQGGGTRHVYNAGYVRRPTTIFDALEEYNIYIPEADRRNPHRATFDIETREIELGENGQGEKRGECTVIEGELKFISFSVVSNVPEYTEPYFKMNETDDRELCQDMISYLTKIKKASARIWHEKMEFYYRILQERIIRLGGVPYIHPEQTLELSDELIALKEENEIMTPAEADMKYQDLNFLPEVQNIPPPQVGVRNDSDLNDEDREVMRNIREVIAQVQANRRGGDDNHADDDESLLPEIRHDYSHHDVGRYIYCEKSTTEEDIAGLNDQRFDQEAEIDRMLNDNGDAENEIEGEEIELMDLEGETYTYRASPRYRHVQTLNNLLWKLRKYGNLPVCGFNSAKFDLLVLREFMPELFIDTKTITSENRTKENTEQGVIIKKGTSYTMFETRQGLVFLDVKNYVPPGLSLAKTLEAYGCKEAKGHFPYTLLGNQEFMSGTTMPDYVDYESTLKGINTLEDSWHSVVKQLYVNKWRPIVQSVIYGHLYSKGKQDRFNDTDYMKVVLQSYQYDKGWMVLAEEMEPPNPVTKRQKYLCHRCGNLVKMILPASKLCMECYDPILDTVPSAQESINLSKSKDDSYLQNYTWFLEQHTCCTGDLDTSPMPTNAKLAWEETTQEERESKKKSRAQNNFITGIENYHNMMKLWQENQWTGKKYLEFYNNLDVLPLLEVVLRMCSLEWEHNRIDCMKNNVSLPNLARIKVWKYAYENGHYFSLFGPVNADQERKQRRCAYGGPSIVFNREQISGISSLNDGYGEKTESILGYDFNSLYPSTFLHNMPSGDCFVYKPDEQGVWSFRSNVQESRKQFIWLDALNRQLDQMREHEKKLILRSNQIPHNRYVSIRTERNGGPVPRIGNYKPDGLRLRHQFLDWELKTYPSHILGICYEMYGCFWHGHNCMIKPDITEEKRKLMNARHAATIRRKKIIEEMGFIVRYIYECDYDKMIRSGYSPTLRECEQEDMPPYVKTIITAGTRQKKQDLLKVFNDMDAVERLLLEGDADKPAVYGFMEVDIIDAENRNKLFPLLFAPLEMDPRLINPDLPAPDPDSSEYTKKHQVLLTGVTQVTKGLYSTEYLRFLLEHGCKITKVYTVQEYTPKKCFKDLALKLSHERAQGDKPGASQEQKILSLNAKITANSMYGALLMNKDHHQVVRFVENGFPVCRAVNLPTFKNAEHAGKDHTEIISQKRIIIQNTPIQISKTVLDLAKMKISEFFWDVLDRYVDRDHYQIFQMDTDSLYFGLAKQSFEECVKDELWDEFQRRKSKIFVQCLCGKKCDNVNCDKRKLNLMKLENYATHAVAITSKTHTEWVADPLHVLSKTSAKGIPARKLPSDTLSLFYTCLRKGLKYSCPVETLQGENTEEGGRVVRKVTRKTGVTGKYNHKRYLLPDQIRTVGLPFEVYAGTPKKVRGVYTDEHYDDREERVLRNVDKLKNLINVYKDY